jgi:hypothetical protein
VSGDAGSSVIQSLIKARHPRGPLRQVAGSCRDAAVKGGCPGSCRDAAVGGARRVEVVRPVPKEDVVVVRGGFAVAVAVEAACRAPMGGKVLAVAVEPAC